MFLEGIIPVLYVIYHPISFKFQESNPRIDLQVVAGPTEWIGQSVWGTGGSSGFSTDGTHADYISVPVDSVSPKPTNLSHEQAAACGVGFLTAYQALIENAQLASGETVLIIGAKGAVGSAAAMLAKWHGATVIGAIRGALPPADKYIDHWVSTDDLSLLRDAVYNATNNKGAGARRF